MRSEGEATLPNIVKYESVKVTQRLSSLLPLGNREGDRVSGGGLPRKVSPLLLSATIIPLFCEAKRRGVPPKVVGGTIDKKRKYIENLIF